MLSCDSDPRNTEPNRRNSKQSTTGCNMRAALALLALAVPAACFVSPQRRLAARPLFAEENADFDPNAKVSQLDEVLIQWGIKDDPRVPEECRVDPMTRIKEAGKAGVAA